MVPGWHGGFSLWLVRWTLNQTIYFVVSVDKTEIRLARLSVLLLVYSCTAVVGFIHRLNVAASLPDFSLVET